MSTKINNMLAALQRISSFIHAKPRYLNIANSYTRGFAPAEPEYVRITNQYQSQLSHTATVCQGVLDAARMFGQSLKHLSHTWDQLDSSENTEQAEEIINQMVKQIDISSSDLNALKRKSSNLHVSANDLLGVLDTATKVLHAKYEDEQAQIQRLKGLLAGQPADVYASASYGLAQMAEHSEKYLKTIKEIKQDIQAIVMLDANIVSVENTVQSLATLAHKTERDGERILMLENVRADRYYRKRFNKDMTALLAWSHAFAI